jgi:hypothetical protein
MVGNKNEEATLESWLFGLTLLKEKVHCRNSGR